MYMPGSKRKSPASSETSTLSPTNSETSTVIMPTPSPKKTEPIKYRTPPPIKRNRISDTPETPTIVSKSPLLDDLSDYSAPFGTPDQTDELEHVYTPPKTKRHKPIKKKGGRSTRKRRRRTYKRSRKTV